MNILPLILLSVTIVANIVLGLLILKSSKKEYSWLFLLVVFSVALWAFGDLLMLYSNSPTVIDIGIKLFYVSPVIIPIALYLFAGSFPNGTNSKIVKYTISIFLFLIAAFPILLNINVILGSVIVADPINTVIPIHYSFILYSIFLSVIFLLSYIYFIIKIIQTKGEERLQISFAFVGVLISSSFAIVTNIVLPLLAIYSFVWLGPPMTMIAVCMIGYAIIKHRLFDIRLFVARATTYILSVFFIGLSYGILAFIVINNLLFPSLNISFAQQFLYALLAVLIGFTFQPLKDVFNSVSDRLFYRDAYDPQGVLNKLNAQLVKSSSIEQLTQSSISTVEDNIHSQFMCLAMLDPDNKYQYYYGSKKIKLNETEEHQLASYTTNNKARTSVFDSNNIDPRNSINQILKHHDIALVSKLIVGDNLIGFEFLGYRKSGNPYGKRDVQLLETAADSIAIAAQNTLRYEEIAAFNVTLQKKIQEATIELQKSNAKLKALDDAKDEFISMASHQLRTPLTSIKGYISMMLEGDAGKISEIQRNFLGQAFISSQRMVYLIADLLNVSRVRTGKFVIEPKPTYLPDIVSSELGQLTETAKARGLTLKFAPTPAGFPTLNLDETKIRQVIMNFADNAIYYTPKGGEITVALGMTKDSVECTVTDTGIGVPKHEQHHLFTKFYRAINARKARPDGTGLGLFMAKKVIAAQGGAIIFKSTEGKGSTFGFSFPRKKLEISNTVN